MTIKFSDPGDVVAQVEPPIDLWQRRAEASLPVIQAALNLTQAKFEIRGKSPSQTIVPTKDYEALKAAVDLYLAAANLEKEAGSVQLISLQAK